MRWIQSEYKEHLTSCRFSCFSNASLLNFRCRSWLSAIFWASYNQMQCASVRQKVTDRNLQCEQRLEHRKTPQQFFDKFLILSSAACRTRSDWGHKSSYEQQLTIGLRAHGLWPMTYFLAANWTQIGGGESTAPSSKWLASNPSVT